MRRFNLLIVSAIALAGCARVNVKTQLSGDGGFTRTVKYSMAKNDQAGGIPGMPSSPEEGFVIPAAGNGVSVNKATDKDQITVTVSCQVAAGASALKDITVLDKKKNPLLTSSVEVKKLSNGQLEYTETLHWVGPRSANSLESPAEFRAIVKKLLPERLKTTEIIDKVTHRGMRETVRILFGPSDPLLTSLLMNQDLTELKLHGALFTSLVPALQEEAPGMTLDEAQAMVRAIIPELDSSSMMKTNTHPTPPTNPSEASSSSGSDMTPLTFSVSFPGKIVKTDGIVDPVTGGVYWSLYGQVVEFEDVTLHLVVDPTK